MERLAHAGLSGMDLRPEAGNGSVGGTGLGFWLFGNKVNVQIRLDSFRFRTSSLASDVVNTADGVLAAIRQASRDELRFKTHAVSYACHGLIEGMKAAEIRREARWERAGDRGFRRPSWHRSCFLFRRGTAHGQLHVDPGCVTGGAGWAVRQDCCRGGRDGWRDSGDTDSCGGARPDCALVCEPGDSVNMPMSAQRLGGRVAAAPPVPELSAQRNSGSVLSQMERAGFGEGHGAFSTGGVRITSGSILHEAGGFGFQRRPRPATRLGESGADDGPKFSRGLASRLSSVSIEAIARQLLARDQILAARKLVDAIPSARFPESLRRLRVVLAEPVVRRRLPARAKRSGDIDWLRGNARSYSGKWVALADGELIAADESLAALRRRLRELAPKIKPLLHRL